MELQKQQLDAWVVTMRLYHWLNTKLAQDMLREDGIRIEWYDILIHLLHAEDQESGLRMQTLFDQTIVTSNASLTRFVDQLVEKGYVKRHSDSNDRRQVFAVITNAGRDLITKVQQSHQDRIKAYFAQHLETNEVEDLKQIFGKLIAINDVPVAHSSTE